MRPCEKATQRRMTKKGRWCAHRNARSTFGGEAGGEPRIPPSWASNAVLSVTGSAPSSSDGTGSSLTSSVPSPRCARRDASSSPA
eukprot:CAMPEP_0196790262 /NCGR_PEP_ID=MMETSP1104-20130614/27936_1 /TAXON_ID=33652 /ORGANISM="Cafeteria sp., Strain Caron Lab Isolate" /LENGTH=84 /DNA_ID=CAMNT_0042160627 /DNA_START=156 /DNA_END=410 /DNA_ORIENTATION=-